MIRVGIAGCGWAGQRHYQALTTNPRAEVLAIAEKDEARLDKLKKDWQVDYAYPDYKVMCKLKNLDAVVIALPHDLHCDATLRAAKSGLNILCEKPIATNLSEANAMIEEAERNDVTLMVAESNRYAARAIKIDELMKSGAIGTIVFAQQNWLHKFEKYGYKERLWLNDASRAGGGQWIINGVHLVSALRSWFRSAGSGDVHKVFAKAYRSSFFETPPGIEASVNALLIFDNGQSANIMMAVEVEHYDRFNGVYLFGTEGTLISLKSRKIELLTNRDREPEYIEYDDNEYHTFIRQMDHFVDCIEKGANPITSGTEERNTLAVIEAGYQSMSTGRAIKANIIQKG